MYLKTIVLLLSINVSFTIKLVAQIDQIKIANNYTQNGEYEKAIDIYKSLAKNRKNIPSIHNQYFELLLSTGEFALANKYVNKIIKIYPNNMQYRIDKGMLFKASSQNDKAQNEFKEVINFLEKNVHLVRGAANYFLKKRLSDYALEAYKVGRNRQKNSIAYAMEIANIYRILNKKDLMIEEYLNYLEKEPVNYNYIKNTLQYYLQKDEDKQILRKSLIKRIQQKPNESVYARLMIWLNIQDKRFLSALIQSKAIDKREKTNGKYSRDVAEIAFENKDFESASVIYEYLIKTYPNAPTYNLNRKSLIQCKEEIVKNTFPINIETIDQLINEYKILENETNSQSIKLESKRNQAHLYAFYLNKKDTAITILNDVISSRWINSKLLSETKLELGDIYLLNGEPWESTLLYSQVEKSNKETTIGNQAKLKNAKLSYFKGDFALAADHLDILKIATTREISNDALSLSLLIKDNNFDDSSGEILKRYANAELLIFQNKKQQALDSLDAIVFDHPNHPMVDEVSYKQAEIFLTFGEFKEAIKRLDTVLKTFGYDIVADDALYLKGKIYQDYLNENVTAQEIFAKFLKEYPGSIYVDDSRKRFRQLRGDQL